ncbi:hypothetical protein BDY17DRAFT_250560 [Neohortaea acidophila]|uniref:Tautomerase cis-CaaD-like domain-containing protein n=1 Tax=Neohortaea acidophila TaxID=245834 RepID=A0A6A6PTA3_9PEZI|nr:uncharacterized protein BDY17DRAFT_250560 [Neohortaea acidophila]KAF2482911.1 hypothetical protein BDY17DRAFT_250560 [Neohortaea acidophila]
MPIYEIQHAIPLSISQKDELAAAITTLHSTTFTTPKLFVQVFYTDVSTRDVYIGGVARSGNHIKGQVRSGASRSQAEWNTLCVEMARAWDKVCGVPLPTRKGGKEQGDTKLHSVTLMGGMVAGLEVGFVLPSAGGDVDWIRENMAAFRKRADEGDEDMKGLVADVEARGLLVDEGKSAVQRLEEALGWGDAA